MRRGDRAWHWGMATTLVDYEGDGARGASAWAPPPATEERRVITGPAVAGCAPADRRAQLGPEDVPQRAHLAPMGDVGARDFGEVSRSLAAQWCGCGARPGAGLISAAMFTPRARASLDAMAERCPAIVPSGRAPPRPLTIPGYAAGPHGFDTLQWASAPDVCADFPMIANIPDRDTQLDPMDGRVWGEPSSDSIWATEPAQAWTYPLGAYP